MSGLAALAAALAVWAWVRPGGEGLVRCRVEPRGNRRSRSSWVTVAMLGAVATVILVGALGGIRAGVAAVAASLVVGTGLLVGGRLRVRGRRASERAEVAHAGEVLAGLLASGRIPAAALVAAAAESPVLRGAAGSQSVGGDVPTALRRSASDLGREGLADLAAAWAVAERTGASLEGAVTATAEQLAGRQEVARTVAAELAAPRATGRMMAVLPVVGLLMGFGFGGNPVAFLLDTPLGWACLVGGAGLACAGVLWTELLADRAGGD